MSLTMIGNWLSVPFLSLSSVFLSVTLGVLLAFYFFKNSKTCLLPPGPYGLPVLGNLHQLGKETHISLHEMSKIYGEVISVYFGQKLFIIVSGKRLISEVLTTRSAEFGIRPVTPFSSCFSVGKSITFSSISTAEHKRLKVFALSAIKKTEKKLLASSLHGFQDDNNILTTNHISLEKIFSEDAVIMGRKMVRLSEDYERKYKHLRDGNEKYRNAASGIASFATIRAACAILLGKRYLSLFIA